MNPILSFLRSLAGKIVVPQMERKLRWFEDQTQQVRRVQQDLLFRKLRRAASSAFGRDHGFGSIRTLADFRRQVPIETYDYYQPYIARVAQGEVTAMFPRGERLLMYTLSSGTTAAPKIIPINETWMAEYRRGWQIWGIKAFLDHPKLFYAKLTGIAGNWNMQRTPSGLPCGMASGLSAKMQSPLLRMMYTIPYQVFGIDDVDAKYYTCLRLGIPEPSGLLLTATPATVVKFAQLADRFRDTLIRDIAEGTLSNDFAIPGAIREQIARQIRRPNPACAARLAKIVADTGHLYPKDFWDLHLVACWLGGTVGTYAQHIPQYYGKVPQRDIGLLCSEGRFTSPLTDGTPGGTLEITSHFYEFLPEGEAESKTPTVLEAHELEEGKSYYILLTTSSGLYRYHISDLMRCVGFMNQTPILEFLNKGSRFSDMEGEKISEFHLVQAVSEAAKQLGIEITGFTAVPIRPADGQPPYYAIMLEEQDISTPDLAEAFLRRIDHWLLQHNVMYSGKRSDLYLGPPRLVKIPRGTWREYDQGEIRRRGVGEDHYKHPCLVLDEAFVRRFPVVAEVTLADPRPAPAAPGGSP